MPKICALDGGISIVIPTLDHEPPHIHAYYNEFRIKFTLDGEIVKGEMPSSQLKKIQNFVENNREQILECWHIIITERKPCKKLKI